MKYGVTKDGFKRKTYTDIIADMQGLAKELFGEDIDVSERNPLGMTLQNMGWEMSVLWEIAEDVYNSNFVDTSEGQALDGTGKYIAMQRKAAQPSKGFIKIEGVEGTKIPIGFKVANEDLDIVFQTTEMNTIGLDGYIEMPIESVTPGIKYNIPANVLTKVVNPAIGVRRCNNPEPTIDGLDIESDKDFRMRYYRSVSLGGSSTRESVEAALLNIPDIVDAFVEENTSMEVIDGIPPKSLAPYVFGGVDQEIADMILLTKAGGIRSFGTTEIESEDGMGINHTIGFTRPTVKDIYINIEIEKAVDYPGDNVVRRAIMNYLGGQDEDGIIYKGLRLGEDVVLSRLISTIGCLGGVEDITIEISFDGTDYVDSNLVIGKKEIAQTTFDKVVINYV